MKKMTGKMAMAMAGLMAFGTMGTGVTAMAAEDGDVVTIKFMHKGPKPRQPPCEAVS